MRRFYFRRLRGLTLLYYFLYTGSRISTGSISAGRQLELFRARTSLLEVIFICLASIGFNEMEDFQHSQLNIDLRYSHLNFGNVIFS